MKNGFSLIELIIAVAILAIITSIAIPQYQNYLLRTHVTTEYSTAKNSLEKAIQEYIGHYGRMPNAGFNDLASIGFIQNDGSIHTDTSLATSGLSSINWNGSHIILQFSSSHQQESLQNKTIEIKVTSNKTGVSFKATGGTIAAHLLPK